MGLFSIDIACDCCGRVWDVLVERSDASTYTEPCMFSDAPGEPECPGRGSRTVSVPNGLRVSTPMGVSGKGSAYSELKQAARLKAERANLPHDKRGDINKEIHARQQAANRGSISDSNKPLPTATDRKKK